MKPHWEFLLRFDGDFYMSGGTGRTREEARVAAASY
jgi:hypothetical protein